MALGAFAVSDDDQLLAYSTDETGFRQYTLMVKDLAADRHLPISRERVTTVAWAADGETLFYVTEDPVTKRSDTLWRQPLGGEAEMVLHEADEAFSLSVHRTRSRDWLVLQAGSHTASECRVLPASEPRAEWRVVRERANEIEYDIDHHGSHFLVRINDTGRNFRLARTAVHGSSFGTLEELIAHRPSVMLEAVDAFAGHVVLHEREDGVPHLVVRDVRGGGSHRVSFPEPAYEAFLHSNPEWNVSVVRISYQSMITPASVYAYQMDTRERELSQAQEVVGGYDGSRYRSERVHAVAADGTRVPMTLVRRADAVPDGTAAGLLVGTAHTVTRIRVVLIESPLPP